MPLNVITLLSKQSKLLILLPPILFSAEEAHLAAEQICEELKEKLNMTEAETQSQCLKMTAEIDDLNRTKINLEERLIELIKYVLSVAPRLSSTTDLNFYNEERIKAHFLLFLDAWLPTDFNLNGRSRCSSCNVFMPDFGGGKYFFEC